MADTAQSKPAQPMRTPPIRRRRMFGVLMALVCAAGAGLAASTAVLAWGRHDQILTWISLIADAAVVILAAELGVRALRRRGMESELLELATRHGTQQDSKLVTAQHASLTVDAEGTVLTWSESALVLTGYSAEQAIGNTFAFMLRPAAADADFQSQLMRTAVQSQRATGECWLVTATGERRWMHLALAPLRGEERWARRFMLVLRDMSESRPAEAAASEREAAFERIVDSAMDAILAVDEDQRVLMFNAAAERVFGWQRDEAIGQPLEAFIPERFRTGPRRHVDAFGETGITSRRMGDQTVLMALRKDGSEFPIEASISQARVDGRRIYTVILRDVSERVQVQEALRRSHEELRQLALALQTAREEEKTRIARELHDELGQGLTALKFDVSWLTQNLPPHDKAVQEKLRSMGGVLDRIVAEMRRISADLRPLILDDLGFGAAAEWLVNDFRKRTGAACECHLDESVEDIGEPVATALFRALQESLTNVARHAHATRVDVNVARRNGAVQLDVIDNGKGIGEGDAQRPGSSGLRGLAQRAMILGGDVRAQRLDSGGTRVTFRVPVAEPARESVRQ
jgi:PAS domain S-box-containing protein